jgi:CubicO group peptidase (beta-lactamase class C family)
MPQVAPAAKPRCARTVRRKFAIRPANHILAREETGVRRWIIGSLASLAVAVAVFLAFAPQLPALILEGYPALVWSGRGHYAEVAGGDGAVRAGPDATQVALDPRLAATFSESGGRALLVHRDGELALEHYGADTSSDTLLNSFSMAKGLIGALVFRALADGRIASLEQRLDTVLPEAAGLAPVTIRSLLTMQSGIAFDGGVLGAASGKTAEMAPSPFSPLARLHYLGLDPLLATLRLEPGGTPSFNYQNINTALLGAVLERVYGQPLDVLLADKLWQPAGAQPAQWRRTGPTAAVSAYCCLYARARDWIAVGVYLAGNGTPDAPFLPQSLWRDYMGLDVTAAERASDHYGMQVHQNVLDREGESLQGPFTYLFGQGGQTLYLMPERNLVVYRAGDRQQLLHSTLYWAWSSIDAAKRPE